MEFFQSANSKAKGMLTRTVAATALAAFAICGAGAAQASSTTYALVTQTLAGMPVVSAGDYTDVETHIANDGTLGNGFDLRLGAFVGDIANFSGIFDFDNLNGADVTGNFAAFRFWNPGYNDVSQQWLDQGNARTGAGSDARIHEIYFEDTLSGYLSDDPVVYASDGFSFEGTKLRPAQPPGIDPNWGGTFAGLDRGRNRDFDGNNRHGNGSSHDDDEEDDYRSKEFTGVGEGQWFEIYFSTTLDNTNALVDILGDRSIAGRIAMHIGNCDVSSSSSDSYDSSSHHSDDEHDSDNDGDYGTSCVVDTWPENVSVVPLPAAMPLYGTGLAIVSLIGWRKRRKAAQA